LAHFCVSQKKKNTLTIARYEFSSGKATNWWVEKKLGTYGGEQKFDLDNIWSFSIDAVKYLPLKSSGVYKAAL
jgi:hypothetical protein